MRQHRPLERSVAATSEGTHLHMIHNSPVVAMRVPIHRRAGGSSLGIATVTFQLPHLFLDLRTSGVCVWFVGRKEHANNEIHCLRCDLHSNQTSTLLAGVVRSLVSCRTSQMMLIGAGVVCMRLW